MSANIGLKIIGCSFSHCVTSSIGGGISCTFSSMKMERSCFLDCIALGYINPDVNCFHAAKIVGGVASSETIISLCGASLCPRNQVSYDETIGIWGDCLLTFNSNNLTDNHLSRSEMFILYQSSVISSCFFNTFHKCNSNLLIYLYNGGHLDTCNIVSNKETINTANSLIQNTKTVSLHNCVIAYNDHINFFYNAGNREIKSCFFCSNGFAADSEDKCVPTAALIRFDADKCQKASMYFTSRGTLSPMRLIPTFQFLLAK